MCLITNQKEPLIATKDIVCYKMINVNPNNPNQWTGIYYGCSSGIFPFGLAYANGKHNTYISPLSGHLIVEGGFFHAITNLDLAKRVVSGEEDFGMPCIRLVKCIIPKGNRYYVSINKGEICSPSMIVYKDLDSYDKSMRCKCSAIIIYFKTLFNKLNIFKPNAKN